MMWTYNYDFLMHKDHKYLDKYKSKLGNWVYVYTKKAADGIKNAINTIPNRAAEKAMPTINKGYNAAANKYNKVVNENNYITNNSTYDSKIRQVAKTKEWQDIVRRKDPEYVKKNADGSYTYKIDDYLVKKKHPVLDILDDAVNGRNLSVNKMSAETFLAGADDYLNAGLAYVGIRAKVLTETMKFKQGSYKEEAKAAEEFVDNALKAAVKTANDVSTTSDNINKQQILSSISNSISSNMSKEDIEKVISSPQVTSIINKYGLSEQEVLKYLKEAGV